MNVAEFFTGEDDSAAIFETLRKTIEDLETIEIRVTKSQIALRRTTTFVRIWMLEKYSGGEQPDLVLSLAPRGSDAPQ